MLRYLSDTIRAEDFERMASAGFNFVRLPLGYWHVLAVEAAPDAPPHDAARWLALQRMLPARSYLPHLQRVFAYAKSNGLRVLLDMHGAPGGRKLLSFYRTASSQKRSDSAECLIPCWHAILLSRLVALLECILHRRVC